MTDTTLRIPLDQVEPDPEQPRSHIDQDSLERLALTIREKGQLVPAKVRREGTRYVLVDGERRLEALKILAESDPKFGTLWAYEGDDDRPQDRLIAQYITNDQREGHTPDEKIRVIKALRGQGRADAEIPRLLGMTEGEFRLLNKLARADPWLLEFGKPGLKIPVVVRDDDGKPKIAADGKSPKTYLRSMAPLPLAHLDVLVTLANKLNKLDQQQAQHSGRFKNLAQTRVTKLAHVALEEEHSVRQLKAAADRVYRSAERAIGVDEDRVKREKPQGAFSVAPLRELPRERQIAELRAALETLGLSAADLM